MSTSYLDALPPMIEAVRAARRAVMEREAEVDRAERALGAAMEQLTAANQRLNGWLSTATSVHSPSALVAADTSSP